MLAEPWNLVSQPSVQETRRALGLHEVRRSALRRRLSDVWMRIKLWRAKRVGKAPRALGRIWIHGGGRLIIGDRVTLDGRECPIELRVLKGGVLHIGDGTMIFGGTSIEVTAEMRIGAQCILDPYCKILDNNFHPLRGDRHATPQAHPVTIEDKVIIGTKSIVLPGARIGTGARILANTVVSRSIPAGITVAGFPAKVVKKEQAHVA